MNPKPLSESQPTNDRSAIQSRQLNSFLSELSLDGMSVEEKVDTLRTLPFEQFLQILVLSHGIALDIEAVSLATWEAVRGVVSTFGFVIDYEAPPDPVGCLRDVYKDVQRTIDYNSYKECAAKLYSAIIFAHMFSDGNGRLARGTYSLMARPGIPHELDAQVGIANERKKVFGYDEARTYGASLAMEGIARILKKNGLNCNGADEIAAINSAGDKGKIQLKIYDDRISGKPLLGNMAFLKFLAAKKAWEEILGRGPSFEEEVHLRSFGEEGMKIYQLHYDSLRRELFFEIQKLHDEHPQAFVKMLEKNLFGALPGDQ